MKLCFDYLRVQYNSVQQIVIVHFFSEKTQKLHKMSFFAVNTEFDDWKTVIATKKAYEESSKTLLVIGQCEKLKGASPLNDQLVYSRVTLNCKAGEERQSKSNGLRKSSTYKRNCPAKVRL